MALDSGEPTGAVAGGTDMLVMAAQGKDGREISRPVSPVLSAKPGGSR
jgi:hypothetical protein